MNKKLLFGTLLTSGIVLASTLAPVQAADNQKKLLNQMAVSWWLQQHGGAAPYATPYGGYYNYNQYGGVPSPLNYRNYGDYMNALNYYNNGGGYYANPYNSGYNGYWY